jgi:dTDP-L-rhamnose 4-epimerase
MQIRDYINYQDVVDANILVLESDDADYRGFNVGGGNAYTVADFYKKVQEVTGKAIDPIIKKYYRYGDTRHIFSDITKLRSIGWQPKVPIESSIVEYWEYLKQQTDIEDILEYTEKTMKKTAKLRSLSRLSYSPPTVDLQQQAIDRLSNNLPENPAIPEMNDS